MDPFKPAVELRQESSPDTRFDLDYTPAEDVNPLELLGNAYLALHHHMAPAGGGFDLEQDDD